MEKIFTPNRWFISFCALLILVVGALKIVADMHIAEEAKQGALNIFSYDWPELGVESRVQSINAHVINRNDHDAIVEVSGRQMIAKVAPVAAVPVEAAPATATPPAGDGTAAGDAAKPAAPAATDPVSTETEPAPAAPARAVATGPPENAEFKAILTFYRANNAWELGKVEQLN